MRLKRLRGGAPFPPFLKRLGFYYSNLPSTGNKRKKPRKLKLNSNHKDCISKLPDDILVIILSCLDIKEAARTSILSHRWEHLWKFYTGSLDFDFKYYFNRQEFHDCIYKVLNSHRGPMLEQLRIAFNMDHMTERHTYSIPIVSITEWMCFAIFKRVQRFELDLNPTRLLRTNKLYDIDGNIYVFPSSVLDDVGFPFPVFDRLTTLCLKSVSVSDSDVANFLSKLKLLEQLAVKNSSSLQNVRVSDESHNLKLLSIKYCTKVENIEVSSTSLVSFKYAGTLTNISFGNIPGISLMSITSYGLEVPSRSSLIRTPVVGDTETYVANFHSDLHLSRLQKLELGLLRMEWMRRANFPKNFPEFSNLEQLELKVFAYEKGSLLCLSSLIGASPRLQKLTLKYSMAGSRKNDYPCDESYFDKSWKEHANTYTHKCLKVVEFIGWIGVKSDVELANYFIDRAGSLEKVIFDLRHRHEVDSTGDGPEAALQRAMQLKAKLPPRAKLITVL